MHDPTPRPTRTTRPRRRAPLDFLLHDATRSPLRRFLPGMSGVRFAANLARRPGRVAGRAAHLAAELARVGVGRSELAPHEKDRRFADEAWSQEPVPAAHAAGLPRLGRGARGLVPDADLDWGDEQRMGFIVDNLVEASAPSNNPLLNPSVLKRVVDTGGGSLVDGGRRFVRDFATRAAGALDGRARRLRGRQRHRGDPRRGGAAHRRVRADPVHAADPEGALGAAADRAADDQQVLRHRPAPRSAAWSSTWSPRASRSTASRGATPTPGTPTGVWTPTAQAILEAMDAAAQDRPPGAGGAARHLLRRDARLDGRWPTWRPSATSTRSPPSASR